MDIPTVAAWLGHADGGALLMRVYAHHRRAHSVSQAAKVVFEGLALLTQPEPTINGPKTP